MLPLLSLHTLSATFALLHDVRQKYVSLTLVALGRITVLSWMLTPEAANRYSATAPLAASADYETTTTTTTTPTTTIILSNNKQRHKRCHLDSTRLMRVPAPTSYRRPSGRCYGAATRPCELYPRPDWDTAACTHCSGQRQPTADCTQLACGRAKKGGLHVGSSWAGY